MRDWLVDMRKREGISTYEAAKRAGICQSYYSAIENGTRGKPLRVDVAKGIAGVFGFDWTRFFDEELDKTE